MAKKEKAVKEEVIDTEPAFVKSETELTKAVRALTMLFLSATFNGYSFLPPEEFMKGVKATVTLRPGQSQSADQLMNAEITYDASQDTKNDKFIPASGYITQTMREFVLAIRKQFTSIHEFKKNLSVTIDKFPDPQDIAWAKAVVKSYNVPITTEYNAVIPMKDIEDGEAIVEFGHDGLEDAMKMFTKAGYFIPKIAGFEQYASKEEDKSKLIPGLTFREL